MICDNEREKYFIAMQALHTIANHVVYSANNHCTCNISTHLLQKHDKYVKYV